jgi:BirA family transcriptional regulator, biotin operon repressor / biotin---[acetyl-CoA-carboxylase] ligase
MADDLSAPLLEAALRGRFGHPLRYVEEIGSTNSEAIEWAAADGPEGALVVTNHQTGGRGRWGRSWFSAPGQLLQFSLILKPSLAPDRHGLLTCGLGVATARAIRDLTGLAVMVKWPNDIVVDGRKLAGMLVESTMTDATIDAAICGIGINVHLEADDIPDDLADKATSIAIELARLGSGTAPARAHLLARIVTEIESLYPAIAGDASRLLAEATELSSVIGHDVVVRSADGSTIEGAARGFAPDGALQLEIDGEMRSVHIGEIEQLRTA